MKRLFLLLLLTLAPLALLAAPAPETAYFPNVVVATNLSAGAITNLSLTASRLVFTDANKKETSVSTTGLVDGTGSAVTVGSGLSFSGGTLSATGGGGSQTPWSGDINGAGYNLTNAGSIYVGPPRTGGNQSPWFFTTTSNTFSSIDSFYNGTFNDVVYLGNGKPGTGNPAFGMQIENLYNTSEGESQIEMYFVFDGGTHFTNATSGRPFGITPQLTHNLIDAKFNVSSLTIDEITGTNALFQFTAANNANGSGKMFHYFDQSHYYVENVATNLNATFNLIGSSPSAQFNWGFGGGNMMTLATNGFNLLDQGTENPRFKMFYNTAGLDIYDLEVDGANGNVCQLRSWANEGFARLWNSSAVEKVRFRAAGDSYISGGNLAIGSTSPAYPLDVTGDINTSTEYRTGGTVGIGSKGVGTITTANTGATNTLSVNVVLYVTAATSAALTDNAGTTEFSGVSIAAFTPIRLQPGGKFTGTSITYATGTASHAW